MPDVQDWYMEFVGAVVASLPRDVTEATAMGWLRDRQGLTQALRNAILTGAPAGGTQAAATAPTKPEYAGVTGPLKHDKSAEGWELVEDVTQPAAISGAALEVVPLLTGEDADLLGDPVVDKVRQMGPRLGQRHAEYLMEHQQEIPEEFQRYSLIFPGTLWRDRSGNHCVPALMFRQGSWAMDFGILEGGVDSRDMMVQVKG